MAGLHVEDKYGRCGRGFGEVRECPIGKCKIVQVMYAGWYVCHVALFCATFDLDFRSPFVHRCSVASGTAWFSLGLSWTWS